MIEPEVVDLNEPLSGGLAREWHNLITDTGGSYFQTPEWICAWAATLGRDQKSVAAIWRVGGRVRAVVALARAAERLHPRIPATVRFWTNAGAGPGSADHAGWVIDESLAPDVVAWLRGYVGRDTLLLRNVERLNDSLSSGFTWREVAETRCPRLASAAYLVGDIGSGKLRKTVRNSRRRLENMGVVFDWHPVGYVTSEVVDDLFELHGDRRSMVGGSSSFSGTDRYALHRLLVRACGTLDGPAAVVASLDARTVGVLYGFVFGQTFSYFQSGWDPAFSSMSMGSVLVDEAIRRTAESGCMTFDFLRGPEAYKYRFGAKDVLDRTLLTGTGPGARLVEFKHITKLRRFPGPGAQ